MTTLHPITTIIPLYAPAGSVPGRRLLLGWVLVVLCNLGSHAQGNLTKAPVVEGATFYLFEDSTQWIVMGQGYCKRSLLFTIPKEQIVKPVALALVIDPVPLAKQPIGEIEYLFSNSYADINQLIPYHYTVHRVRYSGSFKLGNIPVKYQALMQAVRQPVKNEGIDFMIELDERALSNAQLDRYQQTALPALEKQLLDSLGKRFNLANNQAALLDQRFKSDAFTKKENYLLALSLLQPDSVGVNWKPDSLQQLLTQPELGANLSLANQLDSLQQSLPRELVERRYDSVRRLITHYKDSLKQQQVLIMDSVKKQYQQATSLLQSIKGSDEIPSLQQWEQLNQLAVSCKVLDSVSASKNIAQYKKYRSVLKSLRLGSVQASYSDLTVKNLTVRGVESSFGNNAIHTVTAGIINWDFRNSNVSPLTWKGNFIGVYQIALGAETARWKITSYNGSKNNSNTATGKKWINGFSVQREWLVGNNTTVTAEYAKSVSSVKNYFSNKRPGLAAFNERDNEAYALKASTYLFNRTGKLFAGVRYINKDFESFSIWTPGTQQTLWNAGAEKNFWKNKLRIATQHQSLQYNTPFQNTQNSTHTLLSSYLISFRNRKWPSLVAAYYPNNTLFNDQQNQLHEVISKNWSLMASHFYNTGKKLQHQAMITYTRNSLVDMQQLPLYNQFSALAITHHSYYQNIDAAFSYTSNQWDSLHQQIMEASMAFTLFRGCTANAGLRHFTYNHQKNNWGYLAGCTMDLKQWGRLYAYLDQTQIYTIGQRFTNNNNFHLQYNYTIK